MTAWRGFVSAVQSVWIQTMKRPTDEVCLMEEGLPNSRKYPIPLARSATGGDGSDRRF